MKNIIVRPILLSLLVLTAFCTALPISAAQARDVTFTWTANSDPVDGYRLYYKSGATGGTPYDGTGATEGNSPVDTGNVTTFTLHGLSDTETYYFVLTAVAGSLESDYSTELTVAPLTNPPATDITATFSWLPNQETNLAGYKIHYGTASGNYSTTIDVGNPAPVDGRIQGQVSNLTEGTTYYFSATAYDTNGVESDYSTEVVWTATADTGGGTPPTALDAEFSTTEDQPLSGSVSATNDTGLTISYQVQQNVANGTLLFETSSGNFTYTPAADFAGTDSFTFLAQDSNGDSNIATVTISVTAQNDAPTAENGSLAVTEDTPATGQLLAQDPEGDALTYSVVTNPGHGSVTVNTDGSYTYTPAADVTGTDSFSFQASDGQLSSNSATVTITITAVNDPPTALDAGLNVDEDGSAGGQLQAQDPEGDDLTYTVTSNPVHGTVTVNSSGAFTYTPAADVTGTDSFTFQANDGQAASNTATVSVTINPVNDAPVAQDGAMEAFFGKTATGTLRAVDKENDPLTYSIITDPQQIVTLTDAATGAFTLTPVDGMNSPYTFTFVAGDGTAESNTGTVTVTILEPGTVTEIFGDTPDSTHPGTLADTFTNLNEDINDGSEDLITYSWSNPTPHKPANTIIIKADLSALNKNIQITEARLYLYQIDANGGESYENSVHMITGKNPVIAQVNGFNAFNGEPWTAVAPGTTYNDIPLGLADIGPAEDTISLGNQQGYQSWLITDMVQNWVTDSTTNAGLLITGAETTTETGRTFAATENQNSSVRPKLVIRYIIKPPKPTVLSARPVK